MTGNISSKLLFDLLPSVVHSRIQQLEEAEQQEALKRQEEEKLTEAKRREEAITRLQALIVNKIQQATGFPIYISEVECKGLSLDDIRDVLEAFTRELNNRDSDGFEYKITRYFSRIPFGKRTTIFVIELKELRPYSFKHYYAKVKREKLMKEEDERQPESKSNKEQTIE